MLWHLTDDLIDAFSARNHTCDILKLEFRSLLLAISLKVNTVDGLDKGLNTIRKI